MLLNWWRVNINDFDLNNILVDETWYETILIYYFAYKNPYGAKSLRIIFDKADGYIKNMIKLQSSS